MSKYLHRGEVESVRQFAVRKWEDFTPGLYRFIYDGALDSGATVSYEDIVVIGLAPDSCYEFVRIRELPDYCGAPRVTSGSLSDAGVHREPYKTDDWGRRIGGGYLGRNFAVPIEHFQ